MSSFTLRGKCPKDTKRCIVRRITANSDDASSSSSPSQLDQDGAQQGQEQEQQQAQQLPAYVHIEGLPPIFLEPASCEPTLRSDVWRNEQNDNRLPIESILRLFYSSSGTEGLLTLLGMNDKLDFLVEGDASLSDEVPRRAAALFLADAAASRKNHDDGNDEKNTITFQVTLVDPRNKWQFETFADDVGGDDGPDKITVAPLPPEKMTRPRPPPVFSSLDARGVAEKIKTSKRIAVLTGAGVSTSAVGATVDGIPDFRTPKIGLYARLEDYNLPSPEALFTLSYFKKNPSMFYKISNEMNLWPGAFAPTHVHHFLKLLENHGKLDMAFTQNIDTLEKVANVSDGKIVFAHGSYATSSCIGKGKHPMSTDKLRKIADAGEPPVCDVEGCGAFVKPDVVFFGEGLPRRFFEEADRLDQVDLLLVCGTSLQVMPFAFLANPPSGPNKYPRVLINRDRVGDFTFAGDKYAPDDPGQIRDVFLPGDCQQAVRDICEHLGWSQELDALYSAGVAKVKGDSASAASNSDAAESA